MHAAVVHSFDSPPRYELVEVPSPSGPDEMLAEVLAAGLHPRVRSGASGRHYSGSAALPFIPGVDGVGRLDDGRRVYFVTADDRWGSMAEKAVVDLRRSVVLPEDVEPTLVAAAMNPAMSSWVALRHRSPLQEGQSVLVLGATGNAGGMAVQVAKRLGAGRVVAAGRNTDRLEQLRDLGADALVALDGTEAGAARMAAVAAEVDIVLDYLWAAPARQALMAILTARSDRSRALDWVQIGAVAGPTMELPSVALRSANLTIKGNGQGAVSTEAYVAALPSLIGEIGAGTLRVTPQAVSLAEVAAVWAAPEEPGVRVVLVP